MCYHSKIIFYGEKKIKIPTSLKWTHVCYQLCIVQPFISVYRQYHYQSNVIRFTMNLKTWCFYLDNMWKMKIHYVFLHWHIQKHTSYLLFIKQITRKIHLVQYHMPFAFNHILKGRFAHTHLLLLIKIKCKYISFYLQRCKLDVTIFIFKR